MKDQASFFSTQTSGVHSILVRLDEKQALYAPNTNTIHKYLSKI